VIGFKEMYEERMKEWREQRSEQRDAKLMGRMNSRLCIVIYLFILSCNFLRT
jgi:hypothetical protein